MKSVTSVKSVVSTIGIVNKTLASCKVVMIQSFVNISTQINVLIVTSLFAHKFLIIRKFVNTATVLLRFSICVFSKQIIRFVNTASGLLHNT